MVEQLQHQARRVCRIFGINGCPRIDLRLDGEGGAYVLKANPNPQIANGEDVANSAACAGIGYKALPQRMHDIGLKWHPAECDPDSGTSIHSVPSACGATEAVAPCTEQCDGYCPDQEHPLQLERPAAVL